MESSDVIELNSSDDEAKAPAAKKIKYVSNAMVHIPSKLYDTTITPTRNKQKGVGKLSCSKIHNAANVNSQSTYKNKSNGKHLLRNISRPKENLYINPLHVASYSKTKNPVPKSISLPPSITITKAKKSATGLINVTPSSDCSVQVNKKKNFDNFPSEIPVASPQWYLKPEEHLNEVICEVTHNKEPEPMNMIEITIEDSPIKLPNKPISENVSCNEPTSENVSCNEPISENVSCNESMHTPLSKKKLDYPENNDNNINEIHETETASDIIFDIDSNKIEDILENKGSVESQANPRKVSDKLTIDTALKPNNNVAKDKIELEDQQKKVRIETVQETEKNTCEIVSEFHPIYQKLIDLCFELENSEDMKKIVDKKIKTYYKQVSKEYVESEEFLDMVSVKMSLMKAGPEKMFLYIKDIVDELNIQRKMAKSKETKINNPIVEEQMTEIVEEGSKRDRRRRRQIRKLEKTIEKLHTAIQKLDEEEVDFDDEENSVYMLAMRYRKRFVRVYTKLSQITNKRMPSEPRIHIQSRPGKPPGPAKKLEKLINKKVPLGSTLPFPDFHDVLECVRQANAEDRLGWNEAEIREEARDLFTRCGRKLQRRRQENEWRSAASSITQQADPAEDNETLKKELEENKKQALQKEADIVNMYAEKQAQLKLEGVEIGDKEADESPEESEDEDINNDSNALDDKSIRKENLEEKSADSRKESESLSQSKDVPENVKKITVNEESKENNISEMETMNTSEDLMPTNSIQQITCLIQSESVAPEMHGAIVKDNLGTQVTNDGGNDVKVNNCKTSTVLSSSVQCEAEDAKTRKNNLVENMTSEDMKEMNNHDPLILLTDSVQKEANNIENQYSGDGDDIAEDINSPEITTMLPSSVQNETEDAKLQNSLDKDNLATEVASDIESEGIGEVSTKFEYDEHINLINDDSDEDELNLLQKRHSGDDQSDSSESDESLIAISDTLKSDSDEDNDEKYDVISIENSSNSESELTKDDDDVKCRKSVKVEITFDLEQDSQESGYQKTGIKTLDKDSKDYDVVNEDYEKILLASSEDEDEDSRNNDIALNKYCGNYVNLKDDDISISETQLQKVAPINYDMDVTDDCEMLQAVNISCDEN